MWTILVHTLKEDTVLGLYFEILFWTTDIDNTAGVTSEDGGSNDDTQSEDINHHN